MLEQRPLSAMLAPTDNSFGTIRLFAAIGVIISHAMVLSTGDRTADPFLAWTGFKIGDHAVNIFFVLSGIVTAQSLERSGSVLKFAWARILRIVPAVLAFALVFGFLVAPFVSQLAPGSFVTAKETWVFVLKTILFAPGNTSLPGVFAANPLPTIVNESLWTVKYELLCYALLAGCGVLLHRFGRWTLIAIALAVVAFYVATIGAKLPEGTVTHLRQFAFCYSLGLLAYLFADRLPISILGAVGLLAALVWAWGTKFQPMLTLMFTGYSAVWLAQFDLMGLRAWTNRTDLSYGLYVWGWPIGQILLDGVPGMSWVLLAGLNLVFAAIFAVLSWHIVEQPALRLKLGPKPAGLGETDAPSEPAAAEPTAMREPRIRPRIGSRPLAPRPRAASIA